MPATRAIACVIACMPLLCGAATDKECLNHLGGAFADVECYNGLSNALIDDNAVIVKQIVATIPKGNNHKDQLLEYLRQQREANKYCGLSRDSLTKWIHEKPETNPRYSYHDVAYYECVYDNLLHQNKFLKTILDNASEK